MFFAKSDGSEDSESSRAKEKGAESTDIQGQNYQGFIMFGPGWEGSR